MEALKNHSLKIQLGTAVLVLGFVIYWTFIISGQLKEMQIKIDENSDLLTRNKAVIIQLQNSTHTTDIAIAEIKVQLSNILLGIAELKQDIKTHDIR